MDFAVASSQPRIAAAYFLKHGKRNSFAFLDTLKSAVIQVIYQEALRTRQPVLCIMDDTIASRIKPSSQAVRPIEAAYFRQSHLKGRQDYGRQAVSVMS